MKKLPDRTERMIGYIADQICRDSREEAKDKTICVSVDCFNRRHEDLSVCWECLECMEPIPELEEELRNRYLTKAYVYFIQNRETKNIKIGISGSPNKRLESLSTSVDAELLLLACVPCHGDPELEKRIHAAYGEYRKIREWFYPADPVLDLVEMAQNGEFEEFMKIVRQRYLMSITSPGSGGKKIEKNGETIAFIMK